MTAWKNFGVIAEAYTPVHATDGCNGDLSGLYNGSNGTTDGSANDNAC